MVGPSGLDIRQRKSRWLRETRHPADESGDRKPNKETLMDQVKDSSRSPSGSLD